MGNNCCNTDKLSDNFKDNTDGVIRAQELPIQVDLKLHSAVHFNN